VLPRPGCVQMRQEIEEIMSKVRHRWRMKSPTLSIGYRFDLVGHKHERVARGRAYERGLVTDNNDGEELLTMATCPASIYRRGAAVLVAGKCRVRSGFHLPSSLEGPAVGYWVATWWEERVKLQRAASCFENKEVGK
jgi:hypothetical protein